MAKLALTDLVNLQNENTAVSAINANNATLETAFDNSLSRDGSFPNSMDAALDMNSNRIINLPEALNGTEPLRKADMDALVSQLEFALGILEAQSVTTSLNATYSTRAQVAATSINAIVQSITTAGYASAGDGGAATYRRSAVNPAHNAKVQSLDGAWWAISNHEITPKMLGAKGDGIETSPGVWTGTDDTTPMNDFFGACTFYDLLIESGNYICGILNNVSGLRNLRVQGDAFLVPKTGVFTATEFMGDYDPTVTYAIGQSVNFWPTRQITTLGLSADGLTYRCISPALNNTPTTSPANWTVVPFTQFILFNVLSNANIEGLGVKVKASVYPQLTAVNISNSNNISFRNIRLLDAGGVGLEVDNCKNCIIDHPKITNFARHGIFCAGTTIGDSVNNNIFFPDIETTTYGSGHCIGFQNGVDVFVEGGKLAGSKTFGVSWFFCFRGGINGASITDTTKEAINCDGSSYLSITNNKCQWALGSDDLGISITGLAGPTSGIHVANNSVIGAGYSGICLTGTVTFCTIAGGLILNCNTTGNLLEGGVLISGSACQLNNITDVVIIDNRGTKKHQYGYIEADKGNGPPAHLINTIDNLVINGFVIGSTLRT